MIDREALLDELARCFVQAAVTRLLNQQRGIDEDSTKDFCQLQDQLNEHKDPPPTREATADQVAQSLAKLKNHY